VQVDINQHRSSAHRANGNSRGDKRVSGSNHFITGADAITSQRKLQRGCAGIDANSVLRATISSEGIFKLADIVTQDKRCAMQDTPNGFLNLRSN
jgi:hypothetical protein